MKTESHMRKMAPFIAGAAFALAGWLAPAATAAQGASPLAAYPGFGHNAAADEARFDQEVQARQQLIGRCMQQAGFRYTPDLAVRNPVAANRRDAWAAAQARNPNAQVRAELSPDERTRYNMALYGVPDPNDQANLWDPRSSSGGGCWGSALREIPGVFAARARLAQEYIELRQSVARDERVRAAEGRWAQCMQARGLEAASPRALRAAADSAAVRGRLSDAERQRLRSANEAARACGMESGLDALAAQVRAEREAAFVAEHRGVLEAHRERQQSQRPQER